MYLKFDNVSKKYSGTSKPAVDSFDYSFEKGVYGLLGPNGAGKSTLMNMITLNSRPTSGTISLDNIPVIKMDTAYRELLGYMPQQQELYDDFTAERFLWYMASLKGLTKSDAKCEIDRVLNVVNLSDERFKKIKSFSGGMKQRLLIAQAILGNPKIIILDEPTAGLDPKERIHVRNYISSVSRDKIIILATHIVQDIEHIAEKILIMKDGKLLRQGSPQSLLKELDGKVFEITIHDQDEERYYKNRGDVKIANNVITSEGLSLRIVTEEKPLYGIIKEMPPCLEDLYLYLVE